jgi:hypothetical protein
MSLLASPLLLYQQQCLLLTGFSQGLAAAIAWPGLGSLWKAITASFGLWFMPGFSGKYKLIKNPIHQPDIRGKSLKSLAHTQFWCFFSLFFACLFVCLFVLLHGPSIE